MNFPHERLKPNDHKFANSINRCCTPTPKSINAPSFDVGAAKADRQRRVN